MYTGFWWGNLSEKDRHRWEDNIQEVGCGAMDWIDLSQDMDRWRVLVNEPVIFLSYLYLVI